MTAPSPELGYLLLGQPEMAELLMRSLSLKGNLPQYLEGEFSPSVTVADLTSTPYLWLRRASRWRIGLAQAAVAAQVSIFAFVSNIADRSVLALLESLTLDNTTAGAIAYQYGVSLAGTGGVASAAVGTFCDDRQQGTGAQYRGGVGTNAAAPLGGNPPTVIVPPNSSVIVPLGDVLTARDNGVFASAFIVQTTAVNTALRVSLTWVERALLASEK
jgi:hypothetical protein